jgi:hypothetical protein
MVRELGRGLASVRAASGAPLVAGKASTGTADFGKALGVVGSAWETAQWWGDDATLSSGGDGGKVAKDVRGGAIYRGKSPSSCVRRSIS